MKYVNDNVEEAAKLVGNYDIVTEDVAVKAIPECNIVCITGEDMKEQLSGYLAVLKDANPESIGGELRVMTSTISSNRKKQTSSSGLPRSG